MENFARAFFSIKMMTVGLFVFLVAIAFATFMESAYDIDTARLLVYNATWFVLLLFYLGINLIVNIFRYQMWQKEKVAMFLFHISFIVILLGAGVTRYFSFEGIMPIREGETVDYIYSSNANFWYKINDGELQYTYHESRMFATHSWVGNSFSHDVEFPNHTTSISIEYVNYQKGMIDSLVTNDSIQSSALEIVTGGMNSSFLSSGGFMMLGGIALSYDKTDAMPGIQLTEKTDGVYINTALPIRYLPMTQMVEARKNGFEVADSMYTEVPLNTEVLFLESTLYQVADQQFVYKGLKKNTKKMLIPSGSKKKGKTVLTVKITDGEHTRLVKLEGGQGVIPEHVVFNFQGLTYEMEYGAMKIPLPFAIRCNDFTLDKYPGSMVASSFESNVTLIDDENDYSRDQTIFMNNVMDYGGYRFFQSSYDSDEKGTILSVNHDWWGTNITYLGYLMMTIGMILTLFAPKGRSKDLMNKLKKSQQKRKKLIGLFAGVMLFSSFGFSQETEHNHEEHDHAQHQEAVFRVISVEQSEKLSHLMVQDFQGRVIPFHTLADQLLRKTHRSKTFAVGEDEYNAVQTIMSMHMYPDYWADEKVIFVSSKSNLRKKLGMDDKYISYNDLVDEHGDFILLKDYQAAHQLVEMKRGEYDKKLIKLVERFQVMQSVFQWRYMQIVPARNDASKKWYVPLSRTVMEIDSVASHLAINYISSIDQGAKDDNYTDADQSLKELIAYQREVSADFVPSEEKVNKEISYNKMHVFESSYRSYLFLGFIMLLVFFVKIFKKPTLKSERIFGILTKILTGLTLIVFVYHGYGIYMRTIISGHAPWSNGYEAMIFIAWILMLFGLLFSPKNAMILAGAAILASLMIFVTELNLMDPEITPLQPVLKSYWLMIHVAIITGSYAPLGISFILGFLNLWLYIFKNKRNAKFVTLNINELTYVSELSMTIGVFMLTIGTFLGGIWANESWGRYWGWDPKETWALVAVLVYALILHLRYIPGLKGKFLFSAVSMWGYASILFTFFGVNFYLSGLHSYAQGEGLQRIPNWIFVTFGIFVLFTIIAGIRNKMYKDEVEKEIMNND